MRNRSASNGSLLPSYIGYVMLGLIYECSLIPPPAPLNAHTSDSYVYLQPSKCRVDRTKITTNDFCTRQRYLSKWCVHRAKQQDKYHVRHPGLNASETQQVATEEAASASRTRDHCSRSWELYTWQRHGIGSLRSPDS